MNGAENVIRGPESPREAISGGLAGSGSGTGGGEALRPRTDFLIVGYEQEARWAKVEHPEWERFVVVNTNSGCCSAKRIRGAFLGECVWYGKAIDGRFAYDVQRELAFAEARTPKATS